MSPQLMAALTSSRKTAEQLLVHSCCCPSMIKLRICFISVFKM